MLDLNPSLYVRILSFDPGATTGISYLEHGIYRWGMVATPSMFFYDSFLRGLVLMSKPTVVIVEDPPHGGFPNKEQTRVFNRLMQWYNVAGYDVRQIAPAYWKKLVEPTKIEANQHIRDATDMAVWFYRKYVKEDHHV